MRKRITAGELIREIERDQGGLIKRILDHPYLRDLESGRIGKDRLRVFAKEQYHTISCDLRSVALAVARAKSRESQELLLGSLNVEAQALKHLLSLAEELGLKEQNLARSEPLAAAQAYASYLAALVSYGSECELAAALLVDLPVWGGNCHRMKAALENIYGVPSSKLGLFELFSTPASAELRSALLRMVEGGVKDEEGIRRIKTACRLVLEYELMFWDAVYEASL